MWLPLPHSAPAWIQRKIENLASSSLQDEVTMRHFSHETAQPPTRSQSFPQTPWQTKKLKFGKWPYFTKIRWSKVFEKVKFFQLTFVLVLELNFLGSQNFMYMLIFPIKIGPVNLFLLKYLVWQNISFGPEHFLDQHLSPTPWNFFSHIQVFFQTLQFFSTKLSFGLPPYEHFCLKSRPFSGRVSRFAEFFIFDQKRPKNSCFKF